MIACFITMCCSCFLLEGLLEEKIIMFAASSYRLCVGSQSANIESKETKNVEDLLEVDSSRLPSDPLNDDETEEHIITSDLTDKEDKKSDKKRFVKSSFGG